MCIYLVVCIFPPTKLVYIERILNLLVKKSHISVRSKIIENIGLSFFT